MGGLALTRRTGGGGGVGANKVHVEGGGGGVGANEAHWGGGGEFGANEAQGGGVGANEAHARGLALTRHAGVGRGVGAHCTPNATLLNRVPFPFTCPMGIAVHTQGGL